MRRLVALFVLLACFSPAESQHKITIVLLERTAIPHDSIYVVGTFSNWDSTPNPNFLMKPAGGRTKKIELNLPAGVIAFKFHRGSWRTVEKSVYGEEIANRSVTIRKDTILRAEVLAWRDQVITDKWQRLAEDQTDTGRLRTMAALAGNYAFNSDTFQPDSALYYAQEAMKIHQKLIALHNGPGVQHDTYATEDLVILQEVLAVLLHSLGNYPGALELRLSNLNMVKSGSNPIPKLQALVPIVSDYLAMKDYDNAIRYCWQAESIFQQTPAIRDSVALLQWQVWQNIGTAYYNQQKLDSALTYARKTIKLSSFIAYGAVGFADLLIGNIFRAQGSADSAMTYYHEAIERVGSINAVFVSSSAQFGIARLFQKNGQLDSALHYASLAINSLVKNKTVVQSWGENADTYIADFAPTLAELYHQRGQADSAYKYLRWSVTLKDSLYNTSRMRQFQTLTFNEEVKRQQLEQRSREAEAAVRYRVRIYGLIALLIGIFVVALLLYRNNKHKAHANELLEKQKKEIEDTLVELRQTQEQLVQSEKMASLGELTAGIAHEIQNPLNFVNNFSEINSELIAELREEQKKPAAERDPKLEDELLSNIDENSRKIMHHGKRADGIVKGMLQHSRSSNGIKEPTDINVLADEYLRLAYHGLRAKDKSFNATLETRFDDSIGKISVVPQDIGRVILNLITNAFYAVGQRKKQFPDLEAVVSVSTRRLPVVSPQEHPRVEIRITDNGNGIPKQVLDKIFQPFFTTKPTGEGTGLGLSLSFDIVKAHGGTLAVKTVNEDSSGSTARGTTFIIELPT